MLHCEPLPALVLNSTFRFAYGSRDASELQCGPVHIGHTGHAGGREKEIDVDVVTKRIHPTIKPPKYRFTRGPPSSE